MLKAVIFALKLSHRVAETRGWISLKCIEAALVFWACKGWRRQVCVLATRAVLRAPCSLSETTHTPSFSRPLHFEVGVVSMSHHCQRDYQ